MEADVDGSKSLSDQQNAINYAQQVYNRKLSAYGKGEKPTNIATLDDVPLGEDIGAVILIKADDDAVAAQTGAGKALIFRNSVYVEGQATDVAGFR